MNVGGESTKSGLSPDEALDYLIAGVDDRRVADIFDCLHPEFIANHGGFNLAEFTSAFDEFEADFQEDAENLRNADRSETRAGDTVTIRVANGAMSGNIVFKRRDVAFVKTTNDFVPERRAVIPPLGSLIRNADGDVTPTRPVRFDGMGAISPDEIVRLEYRREWLVYALRDVRGVNLVDRINERF